MSWFSGVFRKAKIVEANAVCLALYTFDYDRSLSIDLAKLLVDYFRSRHGFEFKYLGFYNESYADKYGIAETLLPKFLRLNPSGVVNFSFYDQDFRNNLQTVWIEFNISRPNLLTVTHSKDVEIDLQDLLNLLSPSFTAQYGFSYQVPMSNWATAYANGNFQHSKGIAGLEKASNASFERWNHECELIQSGFVRGVYDVNILTQTHLQKLVNGVALGDIIGREQFGTLDKINDHGLLYPLMQWGR